MKTFIIAAVAGILLTIGVAKASGPAYYTCIPRQCSQTIVIFDTWQECAAYQRYAGPDYKTCTIYR